MNSERKSYKYYDFVMAAFVTILLCSNVIGASKIVTLWGFTFGAGILFFPISYIFGDVLTEVYGYARDRRVVWAGFAALIFASFMSAFIVYLPPSEGWPHQQAYDVAFGQTWRIAFASLIAFWCGSFSNSYVMAKMKVWSEGKHLWKRTVGSTIVGEAVDSIIFYPLAFAGAWESELVVKVLITNYVLKVLWEALMTPFTYRIVAFLKAREHEDYFDYDTNFTPFSVRA